MVAARELPNHVAEVRRALDGMGAHALLERLGLAKGARRQRSGALVLCPVHAERTPSCSVQDKDGGIRWHCFGCNAAGDAIALIAAARGLSTKGSGFVETLREAASIAGLHRVLDELDEADRVKSRAVKPRATLVAKAPKRVDAQASRRSFPVGTDEHAYPDHVEVASLWFACLPVLEIPEAASVLRSRGLSPEAVELHDLARALPENCPLPRWARFAGRTWNETGHRLVLPVFDEHGNMRSLRAWRVLDEGQMPKRLPPAGHKAGGLVLANALGRMMLETSTRPEWWPDGAPFRVVIAEGEPDFLTWATRTSDAVELAPAVLGISGSGAWSQAIADRIPSGTRVLIRSDLDEAGERYAREIARTIGARCDLRRKVEP